MKPDVTDQLSRLGDEVLSDWTRLPDIGLYMDQVQTFIDRELAAFGTDDKNHVLTPAMINNYIKAGVVPRAEAKKYAPEHIASLLIVGALKQVLSIPDLHRLLGKGREVCGIEQMYGRLRDSLSDAWRDVRDVIHEGGPTGQAADDQTVGSTDVAADDKAAAVARVLRLAAEARMRILAAEAILDRFATDKSREDAEERAERKTARKTSRV